MFLGIINIDLKKLKLRQAFSLLVMLCSFMTMYAQTVVKGIVKDAVTQQPLQSVSVYFRNGKGVVSNAYGAFTLTTGASRFTSVTFSYVGYKTITKAIVANKEQD